MLQEPDNVAALQAAQLTQQLQEQQEKLQQLQQQLSDARDSVASKEAELLELQARLSCSVARLTFCTAPVAIHFAYHFLHVCDSFLMLPPQTILQRAEELMAER